MNKEQVVAAMVEHINNQNRMAAAMQAPGQPGAMTLDQIEQYIIQTEPQVKHMCSGLYDHLLKRGVIISE